MSTTLKELAQIEQDRDMRSGQRPPPQAPAVLAGHPARTQRAVKRLWLRLLGSWAKGILLLAIAGSCISWYLLADHSRSVGLPVDLDLPSAAAPHGDRLFDPDDESVRLAPIDNAQPVQLSAREPLTPAPAPAASGDVREASECGPRSPSPTTQAKPWYGDRIKLQAIVWGPNPNERMAVINNRVVHQGAVLDGFTVVAIIENAVIVAEGQERRQVFLGR